MQAVRQWSRKRSSLVMNLTSDALLEDRTSVTSSPSSSARHPCSLTTKSTFLWSPSRRHSGLHRGGPSINDARNFASPIAIVLVILQLGLVDLDLRCSPILHTQ